MASATRRGLFSLATSERFERLIRALPSGEQVAYPLARHYVAGAGLPDALDAARRLAADRIACSIDLFGESVADPEAADRVADAYVGLAGTLRNALPATCLSHIGVDLPGDGARARLEPIVAALPSGAVLQVGAEQADRADRILDAVLAVAGASGAVAATVHANLVLVVLC